MNLETAENRIHDLYRYFAEHAPGVSPQEDGELGALWAYVDREIAEPGVS